MKRACAVSNCENKCGHWQSPQNFRFYLGDCHVATVVAPRNDIVWAVATTAMPFEQLSLRAQAWQSPGRETKQLPTQQKQTKQKKINIGIKFFRKGLYSDKEKNDEKRKV